MELCFRFEFWVCFTVSSPFSVLLEKFDKVQFLFKDNFSYKLVEPNNYIYKTFKGYVYLTTIVNWNTKKLLFCKFI
jgi:hypothetical protein